MFFLVMVCRFSYEDVMEMASTERIRWLNMSSDFKKAEKAAIEKVGRGR